METIPHHNSQLSSADGNWSGHKLHGFPSHFHLQSVLVFSYFIAARAMSGAVNCPRDKRIHLGITIARRRSHYGAARHSHLEHSIDHGAERWMSTFTAIPQRRDCDIINQFVVNCGSVCDWGIGCKLEIALFKVCTLSYSRLLRCVQWFS